MRVTGTYEIMGDKKHFIPADLPPTPPLVIDGQMATLLSEAMLHVGKLEEIAHHVPDANRFTKAYVTKEALLSSSIENIHTTLFEAYTAPFNTRINKETQLVINYTHAVGNALQLMHDYPLSTRILKKAHEFLLSDGHADPGNYRKQAVRVGNLVPPPAQQISHLMGHLENYIHGADDLPLLIKVGLVHVQFETIHPYLDGNGRIGRMLMVLQMIEYGILSKPLLYPSYYFKKHQWKYYESLDRVRTHGDFEGWINFFLTAIKESSIDAYARIKDIEKLRQEAIQLISHGYSGKAQQTRLETLAILWHEPAVNVSLLSEWLTVSKQTAQSIINDLVSLQLLEIHAAKRRNGKLYSFKPYLAILERE